MLNTSCQAFGVGKEISTRYLKGTTAFDTGTFRRGRLAPLKRTKGLCPFYDHLPQLYQTHFTTKKYLSKQLDG
jgi:hypothetical protein